MSWLALAQNLPLGRTSRCDCPQCGEGTNTNAAILNHSARGYSLFCHACGYNPFQDKGIQTLDELKRLKELNEQADHIINEFKNTLKDELSKIKSQLDTYNGILINFKNVEELKEIF